MNAGMGFGATAGSNVVVPFGTGELTKSTLFGNQCTGSLINYRTVLTAVHCETKTSNTVSFSNIAKVGDPISSVLIYNDWVGEINSSSLISG